MKSDSTVTPHSHQVHRTMQEFGTVTHLSSLQMRAAMRVTTLGLILVAMVLGALLAIAQDPERVNVVFQHAIPNAEGKNMVAVVVSYPPGGKSAPHHHAPSSFIYAYVLSGTIRSQVGGQPAKIFKAGESFYELPGSHHVLSENASDKAPASMLAVFVVDSKDSALTTPDNKQRSANAPPPTTNM